MNENENTIPGYVGEEALNEAFKLIVNYMNQNLPNISVETDTADTYILRITNPDGSSFLTPNLIHSV